VWPSADNRQLDKPGSPGVTRNGDRLEFAGQVPWSAHHAAGAHKGRRVSFGAAPPESQPAPESWEHYAPDAVTVHSAEGGTKSLTPEQFERKARLGYFVLTFLLDFLILAVFFFVLSLLLRVKGVAMPPLGPLRLLARCLIPACLYSALIVFAGGWKMSNVAVGAFVVVLGMNAILFVLGSKPEPPAEPFAV
jgi:hypothetical protein